VRGNGGKGEGKEAGTCSDVLGGIDAPEDIKTFWFTICRNNSVIFLEVCGMVAPAVLLLLLQ